MIASPPLQVQSTLLLPVFLSPQRHGCVGVLEVVQTSEDMRFMEVSALISNVLEVSVPGRGYASGEVVQTSEDKRFMEVSALVPECLR